MCPDQLQADDGKGDSFHLLHTDNKLAPCFPVATARFSFEMWQYQTPYNYLHVNADCVLCEGQTDTLANTHERDQMVLPASLQANLWDRV